MLFGVLHFGYGIESFLSSFVFGIAFVLIVLKQQRIEFVSGAHNANNLILSLFFIDLNSTVNKNFSWSINWLEFSIQTFVTFLLVIIVYKYFPKNG